MKVICLTCLQTDIRQGQGERSSRDLHGWHALGMLLPAAMPRRHLKCGHMRQKGIHTEPTPSCACRFRVPFKNFVVVSDPRLIPAVLGRPGLPKTQLYKMTRTVSTADPT